MESVANKNEERNQACHYNQKLEENLSRAKVTCEYVLVMLSLCARRVGEKKRKYIEEGNEERITMEEREMGRGKREKKGDEEREKKRRDEKERGEKGKKGKERECGWKEERGVGVYRERGRRARKRVGKGKKEKGEGEGE